MKTLITAVMLSVIATEGFAIHSKYYPIIETANKILPKGKFISLTRLGFIMTHKGKVYHCKLIEEFPRNNVGCWENTK